MNTILGVQGTHVTHRTYPSPHTNTSDSPPPSIEDTVPELPVRSPAIRPPHFPGADCRRTRCSVSMETRRRTDFSTKLSVRRRVWLCPAHAQCLLV